MDFINVLLQNSNLKEAKLYSAAQKAAANPEIGVTIENKAAYYVIRDCASITLNYLPHLVFGSYQNPFESLKGKFTKEMLNEFVKQSETDLALNQLLCIIIAKAEKMNILSAFFDGTSTNQKFQLDDRSSDPYGDYGHESTVNKSTQNSILTPLEILYKLFLAD